MFALWSVEIKFSIASCSTAWEHNRRTSRRAADRAMNSVIHQTAAPIGRVMSNAVPASVPTRRGGHTSNAYCNEANRIWVSRGRVHIPQIFFVRLENLQGGNSRISNGRHSPNTLCSLPVSKTVSTHLTRCQLALLSQALHSKHLSTTLSSSHFFFPASHLLALQQPHQLPPTHHQHGQPKAGSFHPPGPPPRRDHTVVQESPLLLRVRFAHADYRAER